MNLALLYWFYRSPKVTENHLQLLKQTNPSLKIFGLFGGQINHQQTFKKALSPYLEDFYISPFTDSDWKWINGDLMLQDWFDKRGKHLDWDSVSIIQWDTLVFDSLLRLLPDLSPDQIFLSGLRPIDTQVLHNWNWVKPGTKEGQNYTSFMSYVNNNYHFAESPLCCLFIFSVIPRIFFEKFSQVKNKDIGMLEYKIPIYAQIFRTPFYKRDMGVWWYQADKRLPLNAMSVEIPTSYIKQELSKEKGRRLFHPYSKLWRHG